jgi:hypothetical protein
MKTASLVLGIIGGALAIIFAIVFMAGGALFGAASNVVGDLDQQFEDAILEGVEDSGVDVDVDLSGLDGAANFVTGTFSAWAYIAGGLSIVGAVLGIIGAVKVKKSNVAAGILMLVAAIPSFFTGIGFIASIVFIIGGILSLASGKSTPAAA